MLNILKERIIVIGNLFSKLGNVKNVAKTLSKKPRFRARFESQHLKESQILVKSPWECFYHVFSSLSGKLTWKVSALELGEVLGVFVNTLSADDKYSVQYCQNLQLPIQMQLSEKRSRFSEFFVPFLDCTWEFKDIEKKMMVIANVFPKLQTEKVG